MKLFVIIGICVAVTNAQVPIPCEAPREFEGTIIDSGETGVFIRAEVSYDKLGQRIRYIDEIVGGHVYEYLGLFSIGRHYVLDRNTRQCNSSDITSPFHPYSINPGASFVGEAYIGGSVESEGVLCQFWASNSTSGVETLQVFTYPSCLPVNEYYNNPRSGRSGLSFFDLTLGIKDPSVFFRPKECAP